MKSTDQLKNHIDLKILPKECRGQRGEAEMVQDFIKLRDEKNCNNYKYILIDVDWCKVPNEIVTSREDAAIGSFRKLEDD